MKTLALPVIAGIAIFVAVLVGGEIKSAFGNFDRALDAKITSSR